MKDYKILQEMYHSLHKVDDFINQQNICFIERDDLVNRIIAYFTQEVLTLEYPAKSYAVAIIYAKLLEHYFNEDFYKTLNDPDLLYNNDKFFVPYDHDSHLYDHILSRISLDFDRSLSQIDTTIQYFEQEFFIGQEIYDQVKNINIPIINKG